MTLVTDSLRTQHPPISNGAYDIYLVALLQELEIVNEWYLVHGGTQHGGTQIVITIVLGVFHVGP